MVMPSAPTILLILRFCTMTLSPLKMSMPAPVMTVFQPEPMTDLLEPTLRREGRVMAPLTRTILGSGPATAAASSAAVVAQTVGPPFPPVVLPMGLFFA